jgi:hypothetical protein
MATQNSKDIRNKASSIVSIMNNKKLSKTVLAAWNAPVGSTKNINARKILQSLNKANTNYGYAMNDGQGGGTADWINQYFVNPLKNFYANATAQPTQGAWDTQKQSAQQQNIQFLQSIDNMINAPTQGAPISVDPKALGAGQGPRAITALAGAIMEKPRWVGEKLATGPSKILPAWSGAISQVVMPGYEALKNWWNYDPEVAKTVSSSAATPSSPSTPTLQDVYNARTDVQDVAKKQGGDPLTAGTKANDWLNQWWNTVGKAEGADMASKGLLKTFTSDQEQPKPQGHTGIPVVSGNSYTYVNKDGSVHSGQLGDSYVDETIASTEQLPSGQYQYDQGQYNYDPGDTIFNQLAGITYPAGSEMAKAQEAYASGTGSTAFMLSELLDREGLAKRLKMSPEAAASIPNVFLQDKLNEIESAVNNEYQIDKMRNHLTNKINQGLTLEQDYSDYIKGKDEYLGKIDSLLDSAYTKIAKMDTSNPYVFARVKNYTGYLTVLKGRQEKRYIDFLDMSIKQWNAELTRETNWYNTKYAEYEKAVASQQGTATEWDKTFKDMLKEMYNSVEKMEDRVIKLDQAERDKVKDNLDIALDTMKYMQGGDISQTDKDRALKTAALQKYAPTQNADGYVDSSSYTEKRTMYILETGDASAFDEAYSPYLTPQDRASLGVGKAVGETATPEKTTKEIIQDLITIDGLSREQIEKLVGTNDKGEKIPIPPDIEKILDDFFGKKKSGLFGWGTGIL